jgi:hypothetical protein
MGCYAKWNKPKEQINAIMVAPLGSNGKSATWIACSCAANEAKHNMPCGAHCRRQKRYDFSVGAALAA